MMFLVKRDSVHVYCNPINYLFLLPYIGSWPNLRIHCLKEDDVSVKWVRVSTRKKLVGETKKKQN
jgi:hypothetical protein